MKIFDNFENINLSNDQHNAIEKLNDFLQSNDNVFILKGYAGTGKTTILKGVANFLKSTNKNFLLCAPTGRAAKVLRTKTGYGKTIHSTIYDFEKLITINSNSDDLANNSFKYLLPIVKLREETIVIVDEASMISSKESRNELFDFGTNILLNDLLSFIGFSTSNIKNKLIVVGDPAQLPPIGDNNSYALEKSFYEDKGLCVKETFLTKVMRQDNNLILYNATKIRNCIENPEIKNLQFSFDDNSCISYNNNDIVEKYCEHFPFPEFNSGVIITYSNNQCYHLNNEIRKKYFPNHYQLAVGDIVQIINNNYYKYPVEIFNGDFAKIIKIGERVTKSADVYIDIAGEKKKINIKLSFINVTLRLSDYSGDFEAYINETVLNSVDRDITTDEMKAIYINTIIRYKKEFPENEIESEHFKNFLKMDDFFNAIRIKYGYAITGHKSQGGEWDTVFVDYYGRTSLKKDPLRWCYTTTTRASNRLYAINYPDFGKYCKLKFSDIQIIKNIPANAFSFENVPLSPYHNTADHICTSWLYWNVIDKIEGLNITISKINSNSFHEIYTFIWGDSEIRYKIFYNSSGYFSTEFICISEKNKLTEKLDKILNSKNIINFQINYNPSENFLYDLYTIVKAACNDVEVNITNIEEKKPNFYVSYYFETINPLSLMQFYFNIDKEITSCIVKTLGDIANDTKLNLLLEKIKEYASNTAN